MGIEAIFGAIVTIFVAVIGWHIKSDLARYKQIDDSLSRVQAKLQEKATHTEVRMLIQDKVDPLRQDIKELREDVQQLNSLLIKLLQNLPSR